MTSTMIFSRSLVTKFPCRFSRNPPNFPVSRWMSNDWKPGSSWRKVSRSEYPKSFNSKPKFRFPSRREIKDYILKGPKFLRIPESVKDIEPLRLGREPQTKHNRERYIFNFFRLVYNYMDSPSRNVMLLYRPTAFTAFFTASSYVATTIWGYEDKSNRTKSPVWGSSQSYHSSTEGNATTVNDLINFNVSGWVTDNLRDGRKRLKNWWNYQATAADKIFWPICALNGMVFLMWRLDVCAMSMVSYFAASPNSRTICWPLFLSTFSHYSFIHMAMNMFVLHSFLPSAVAVLGKYDTLFLYLSGGVVSAYGSHMFKILKGVTAPSLGASGAIMALLGFVCTQYPDAKLGIVFIPGLTFTADTGIKCLVAVDTAGMVFGWKLLDHAAHLSGVLYGVLFSHAHHHLEPVRDSILNVWRQIRTLGRG